MYTTHKLQQYTFSISYVLSTTGVLSPATIERCKGCQGRTAVAIGSIELSPHKTVEEWQNEWQWLEQTPR